MSLFYLLVLGIAVVSGSMAEKITAEQACAMPVDRGECTLDYLAWYYDNDLKRCAQFSYSGCGGNRNRFGDRASCENACFFGDLRYHFDPQVPRDCRWPGIELFLEVGCLTVTKFGYNRETQKCLAFEIKDCGERRTRRRFSRGNQFDDEASCKKECVDRIPQPPETPVPEDPDKIPTFCMELPYTQEYCRDEDELRYGTQYYYNKLARACVEYRRGRECTNENNTFDYLEDCTRVCKTVAYDPDDARRRLDANRHDSDWDRRRDMDRRDRHRDMDRRDRHRDMDRRDRHRERERDW